MGNSRRRAKLAGVEFEEIDVFSVFERDLWRCQICGKKTPRENRGTKYSNAPEIDHRTPLSKGGSHTYDNVQCACHRCNAKKSNKNNRGQLPLFTAGGVRNAERRL
jgi:5-methylcytosine-specific restriction endonuclease McrA